MITELFDVFAQLRNTTEHLWALSEDPVFWSILGLFFLLLLVILMTRSKTSEVVAFKNEKGQVVIARKALEELVENACCGVSGIDKVSSSLHVRSKGVSIRVRLRIESGHRLSDVATLIQDKISYALREELSVEAVGPIEVIVTGVKRPLVP